MSHGEQSSPFGQLPPEIFAVIFEFLGIGDKKILRTVCNRWCSICDEQTKFKFTPIIDGNDSVKNLLNAGVIIDNVTFKNLTQADWPYPTLTRNQFPHIKRVTLENGNSDDAILPFLNRFGRRNLECLQLREHSFFNFGIRKMTQVFRDMAWENLSELNFSLNHDRANRSDFEMNFENPEEFTKFGSSLKLFLQLVKAPKLRKLVLKYNEINRQIGREEMFKPFYNALVGFISRHSRTLKVLEWAVRFTGRLETYFQGWTVSEELQEIINRDLKLESFSTAFVRWGYPYVSQLPATLVFPCVWGSTGLKTFSCRIEETMMYSFGWWRQVPQLRLNNECIINKMEETMRRNAETLEILSIPFTSTIQLNNLSNCLNLRKLIFTTFDDTFNDMDTNLNLRLPTVTHLELKVFQFTLPMTLDSWITRVFRNIETIKTYLDIDIPWNRCPLFNQRWTLTVQMLQNLLQLSKLKTIVEVQRTRIPGEQMDFVQGVLTQCSIIRQLRPMITHWVRLIHG